MTLELDIDDVYMQMLEQIEEQVDGDPKEDLERIVENQIHQSYQQLQNGQS